jgi:hypothetical protein
MESLAGSHLRWIIASGQDSLHNRRFRRMDLSFALWLALQRSNDLVAVTESTTRPTRFHASTEATSCLVRQIDQKQGVHCSLEAHVEMVDLTFEDRD